MNDLSRAISGVIMDLVPLGMMALAAVLVGMNLLAKHRSREQRYQMIRFAMEKGLPVPPEIMQEPQPQRNDLARGVKLISAGIGVSAFLLLIHQEAWPIGLAFVALGVGYVTAHALVVRRQPSAPQAR